MSNLNNLLSPIEHQLSINFSSLSYLFPINVIAASTISGGIGLKGKLPWPNIKRDMRYFQYLTTKTSDKSLKNVVVMGKNTWLSIPFRYRPLKDRINFILSTTMSKDEQVFGANIVRSYEELFESLSDKYAKSIESVYIIGGEKLYYDMIQSKTANHVYLTRINHEFECDKLFPHIPSEFYSLTSISETYVENEIPYDFLTYTRLDMIAKQELHKKDIIKYKFGPITFQCFLNDTSNDSTSPIPEVKCFPNIIFRGHQEFQYLDCITHVLNNGSSKSDRTGVGTISTFGYNMRFSLRKSFPLLTTKRVFWKGVVEELLWFIRGDTNGNNLLEKGIKIWQKNGSRDYLDSIGLHTREENDLGPIYGFQWRHFGAEYTDMKKDYKGEGIDQLLSCINQIKTNKNDRRIILTAWNPSALSQMALPPCHVICQFYIANNELSCLMFQRSCDIGLGVPFNIASYSLLTCLISQVCDLKRGDFFYCLGDTHIYNNHVDSLKLQLKREPRPFPILELNKNIKDIDKFTEADIKIKDYFPHCKIQMEMAV